VTPPLAPAQDVSTWGALCVVSPHLDDAVLSCGALLSCCPGSTILTVFSGDASAPDVLTPWDQLSGHANAGEAMRARRAEDRAAGDILGCAVSHLPFEDGQYAPLPSLEKLAKGLGAALESVRASRPFDTLVLPLGLHHADHLHVAESWQHPDFQCHARRWIAYEDVPYRRMENTVQAGLAQLHSRGISARAVQWTSASEKILHDRRRGQKANALAEYLSQLRALPSDWLADAAAAEHYWQVSFSP
jgi:LmbE family N-acetylglucosaminyl deacetylase